MRYRRVPIEIESPEEFGYDRIVHNLAESSVTDAVLGDLDLSLDDVVLAYGDHRGKPELREMLAGDGDGLRPGDVLLTVGAAAALFMVNTSLLQPGDRVLVAHPNYATNVETPRAIGCRVDTFPLTFDEGFRLDVDRLAEALTPETKLVSLTCPHNPTGSVMSLEDLHRIVELVEWRGCHLLLDETYREMTFGEPLPIASSLSPRAISVSSLSKTYGLPGIRLGWLSCADPELMETFLAAKEQIFIANSVVDEEIAHRFLRHRPRHLGRIRAHIRTNLEVVRGWMAAQEAMEWIEPQGGVVCFPRIRPDLPVDVDRFYRVLNDEHRTFVGPGHWFEQDRRHMRIGFGWPGQAELAGGLAAIGASLEAAAHRREHDRVHGSEAQEATT